MSEFEYMAALLYPADTRRDEDPGELFRRNRRWFLGAFVGSSGVDIILTWSRGDRLDPPHYRPFVLHLMALGLLGMFIDSRRFDPALAGDVFLITLGWSFGARFLLT